MPNQVRINLADVERVARRIEALSQRITDAVHTYMQSHEQNWVEFVKAVIQHVVYDAYNPTVYVRRADQPLKSLVDAETRRFLGGTVNGIVRGVITTIFNDSTKMRYRRRADRSIGPRDGAQPHEVPWQIETGSYPLPWYGVARPRAAYEIAAAQLAPEITIDIETIVRHVIQT